MTDNNRRARFYRLTPARPEAAGSQSQTAYNKMVRSIQLVMRTTSSFTNLEFSSTRKKRP